MAKYDDQKPPLGLIPPECLEDIAVVFGFGAEKYGVNNWRNAQHETSWITRNNFNVI